MQNQEWGTTTNPNPGSNPNSKKKSPNLKSIENPSTNESIQTNPKKGVKSLRLRDERLEGAAKRVLNFIGV
jgi:hypothetical protein